MSYFRVLFITILILSLAGCAETPVIKPPKEGLPVHAKGGTYHRVVKGETLWRIAKNNGVDLETLVEANGLADAGNIKVGQDILIPAKPAQPVSNITPIPVYSKEDFIWPVKGKVISSFGQKRGSTPNKGVDIQAREGTAVIASRSGRVIFSDDKVRGFGKTVILDHGDGIQTVYSHNSEILVRIGEDVRQAQPVAKVGSGGRGNSPYLHFEIRKRHKPQNPFYYLS
ncbi:MAG: LysM peptidoglycan-binding domain-containing M23 family metallopeptidase [Candidatus Omnitrophica bacterium]|nr:LysM peptidoglycan-binding domain-containing M23 family metallopeptidase [Candidatus Omnitrophota bacterium]MDD5310700.1 LysM peptidoglycan-binding domain-containing M23 family metallopeptidase [Candidatus Omnitrophota bacterium]MDD5545704.1 LysM peptidoglycan-binding domain-containing M23 family metallopeptidase [Candidatus Omnitrophota bacterium]